jgi:peptidoglycan/xylan/chitin deacetylase (PgdA/CDA1 family)
LFKQIVKAAVLQTPLPEMISRWRANTNIAVLGYHRISPPVSADYPFNEEILSATPEEFSRELRYLRDNLDVISIRELLAGLRDPRSLPARAAVITFDDGYRDNEEIALPLLREAGLPACFFLTTGIVGTDRLPWYEQFVCCLKKSRCVSIKSPFGDDMAEFRLDSEHLAQSIRRYRLHLRSIPWSAMEGQLQWLRDATGVEPTEFAPQRLFMSWSAAARLLDAGMEIGAHTRTHPMLSRVDDPATLWEEIAGSRRDIATNLGVEPLAFAYPFGLDEAMSPEADHEIARAGFATSFSYVNAVAGRRSALRGAPYRFPRFRSEFLDSFNGFRLALATVPVRSPGAETEAKSAESILKATHRQPGIPVPAPPKLS